MERNPTPSRPIRPRDSQHTLLTLAAAALILAPALAPPAAAKSQKAVPPALDMEFRPLPAGKASDDVLIRARATLIKPAAYVRLDFGGKKPLEFTQFTPLLQAQAGLSEDDPLSADDLLEESLDVIEEPGKAYTYLWLKAGIWSPAVPVRLLGPAPVIRVAGMNPGKVAKRHGATAHENVPIAVTNVTVEFEILYQGKTLKTFSERATEGNIILIRLGLRHLVGKDDQRLPPGPEFLAETQGIEEYARIRADALEALPWAKGPLPKRYIFMTCCDSKAILNAHIYDEEYRTIRQLGVNGLFYSFRPQVEDAVRSGIGPASAFGRARGDNQGLPGAKSQYLLPEASPGNTEVPPGAGCPYHPVNADLAAWTRSGVAAIMEQIRKTPYDEYWFQTISEIGCVFDRAPERKAHMGSCPYCRQAFREFVKRFGLGPADFGARDWDEIRPTWGYFSKPFEEQKKEQDAAEAARLATIEKEAAAAASAARQSPSADAFDALTATMGETPGGDTDPEDKADDLAGQKPIPLPDYGVALLRYYSARFNNEASAQVFAPLREAFREQNETKRQALAAGQTDSPEARQPFVYSFALRGNTFLMRGHSLDFFDWYRHADSAFMYETSNRDPRIWGWDSYLCDVGRIHQDKLGTAFGLMIKPSRGAVVQRTLTAVARKVRAIYWYTYGPDYVHPDTFASPGRLPILSLMSRTVHMLGEAEDVIYDADWAVPAEIAVVRPLASAILDRNNAACENGKWVFSALTHAHLPVDALDEGYLLSENLTRYKAIYISGANLRRDVADTLRRWVEAGGVLVTSADGLARDESNRPLAPLQSLLGLKARTPVETWGGVRAYGSTALAPITPEKDPPAGAAVKAKPPFLGSFPLAVGREVLQPEAGTEILATCEDGAIAATRRATGKGWVYAIGFYPGLEYASDCMVTNYDMSADFKSDKRSFIAAPALAAGVLPVVDVSHPLIEGVLLQHPKTGRQAVILMNWAYRAGQDPRYLPVPAADVTVTVRCPGTASKARSLWRREPLTASRKGSSLVLTLPAVDEGDILLLE